MKINIQLTRPTEGSIADIRIEFQEASKLIRRAKLNFQFEPLYDFSKETISTSFDLLLITAIVYGIDNLFDRHIYSIDGWAREFEVKFPVNNLDQFNNIKSDLNECLTFLTGDYWDISFSKNKLEYMYLQRKNRRKIHLFDKSKYQFASLFSGGLDSLVGAIDLLQELETSKKVLLISHFDSNSVGPNKDQTELCRYLSKVYKNKVDWVQSTISLANNDDGNNRLNKDNNYRSRSFLFLGIGNYLVNSNPKVKNLIVPENGTISLNYPLTPSRSSSLSTRTTHPYFINRMNKILDALGADTHCINPYGFKTKGEVITGCRNTDVLIDIFQESVSCGKRGRRQHWKNKVGTNHCGTCIPCVYRRAGLHKLNLDTQLYGSDLLNLTSIKEYTDVSALIDFLSTTLTHEQIKRDLIVNGSFISEGLDDFAELIIRSKKELKQWIKEKGNDLIKSLL